MAKLMSRATRQRFAADITASDVARAKAYFRKRFSGWNDCDEMVAEAVAHYWQEYCTSRYACDKHDIASRRATFRAAGRITAGARFARAVATQYVDALNPADWQRRKAIDDAAAEDRLAEWIRNPPRAVDPWTRLRLELFAELGLIDAPASRPRAEASAVEPNRNRCGEPSPRVRPQRCSWRPVEMQPVAPAVPAAPDRRYGQLRHSRHAWNIDRLEARIDSGEWMYVAATEYALAKAN